jgi:YD repeat-containing protein
MPESVKSITLLKDDYLIADLHTEDLRMNSHTYSFTLFDESGNILEEIKYTPDGLEEERIIRKYDNGYLAEEIYYAGEEDPAQHHSFQRGPDGKIMKEFRHYLDGSVDTVQYAYDEEGRLVRKETLDEEELTEMTEIFDYDGNNLSAEREVDGEGNLVAEKTYVFNDQGHLIEFTDWNAVDDKRIRTREEFDEHGKRMQTLRFENDKLMARNLYEEDDQGRIVSIREENRQGITELSLEYDDKGNVVVQEERNQNGELVSRVERIFDDRNRLAESHAFIDGQGRRMSQKYSIRYVYEPF